MTYLRSFFEKPYSNLALCAAFAVLSFPVMARLWFDYLIGGTGWRQGDWLINFGAGPVRRGGIGEALIMFSDLTSLPLLATVLLVQSSLFALSILVLWLIALFHKNRPVLLFLAASPAFFPIFWASDLQGIMRKELIGYLAFSLLVLGAVRGGRQSGLAIISVILFSVGCMGNIMHTLLGGAMIAALWLAKEGGQISDGLFRRLAILSAAMSLLWLVLAVIFSEVESLAPICDPLLIRGMNDAVCQDALRWLVTGEVDHLGEVRAKITMPALTQYGLLAGAALIPACLSFFLFRERRLLALLAAITFLPMLPLYVLATDWGRWLSIPYTSFVFLTLQAHAAGRLSLRRLPPAPLTVILLLGALLITHEHTIGWQPGGAVKSVILTVMDFR